MLYYIIKQAEVKFSFKIFFCHSVKIIIASGMTIKIFTLE